MEHELSRLHFLLKLFFFHISGELVLVPSDTKIKYEENGAAGKSFTTIIISVTAKGNVLLLLTVYTAKQVNSQ